MAGPLYSPVSPIDMSQLHTPPPCGASSRNFPTQTNTSTSTTGSQAQSSTPSPTKASASWLPFTLQWYYLAVPITLSLSFGALLVYLTITSHRNHGLGADDGSSAILFGWRFTPTLIAVLYAQMTVILFEDVKRTEPFARLANAPAGGARAYGTILQTPRAWWSIFMDVCFRRKRLGKTSWALICAACVNVIALLAISPLSSALLTSEEVIIPKTVTYTRITPKANRVLPVIPTRETYYRTVAASIRNVSTSAWIQNTSLTFPFWPSGEQLQLGPRMTSSFTSWELGTLVLQPRYECQNMTLESADLSMQRYFGMYDVQDRGPLNGTQPMVTFALASRDGCRYQLMMHPQVDIARQGGVTWSNASTYHSTGEHILPIGGRVFRFNITSTAVHARINASQQCRGREILIANTPWTKEIPKEPGNTWTLANQTYERSSDFKMRALLCQPRYNFTVRNVKKEPLRSANTAFSRSEDSSYVSKEIHQDIIDVAAFEQLSMSNLWKTLFDGQAGYRVDLGNASNVETWASSGESVSSGYSGMAPLLGAIYGFNRTRLMDDPDLAKQAEMIRGCFFAETFRDVLGQPNLIDTETVIGKATVVEVRVVVLREIGIALAVLCFASTLLLFIILGTSRLSHRRLNLQTDPASAIGVALLIDKQLERMSLLRDMHGASREDLYTALQKHKYLTMQNVLSSGSPDLGTLIKVKPKNDWRPRVLHAPTLAALSLWLILILVAILVLNAFSARSALSQLAFIYEADVSRFGLSFATFAPISIAPTVISVMTTLWWDQLDMTFRVLQPFISMSRRPTSISKGAGLTYRSKTWIGASIKAGRNGHWVLFMITLGTVLAQVLTVSMSALFERKSHNTVHQVSLTQHLELRQVPMLHEIVTKGSNDSNTLAAEVLSNLDLYVEISKNWVNDASIQHSLNGSRLPWTSQGWSFLPLDLTTISGTTSKESNPKANTNHVIYSSSNLTMDVPAIRARLQCRPIDQVGNTSSWLEKEDLSKRKLGSANMAELNLTNSGNVYKISNTIFGNTSFTTSALSRHDRTPVCCSNGTSTSPRRAVMGHWSPGLPNSSGAREIEFPYADLDWPLSLVPKWIVGNSFTVKTSIDTQEIFFSEIPKMQAAYCMPLFENGRATITVDIKTGNIHKYDVFNVTSMREGLWTNVFTRHEPNPARISSSPVYRYENITLSYGVLFLESLWGAVDSYKNPTTGDYDERFRDQAFAIRDESNGLNMDMMTYSMYNMAQKNPEALLDYSTLVAYADTTFQTFFQHFVTSGLSLTKGGNAYQPINHRLPKDLGKPIDSNGTRLPEHEFPSSNSNSTVPATLSQRVRILHMNKIATYLSASILVWLILTTFIAICLQKKYTSSMHRDVQLIADVLVLMAGSNNLLQLVAEKGVDLKKDTEIKTMLGWFRDINGQIRWGIEIVGGRNAVDWVDAPKHGFHAPQPSKSRWWKSLSKFKP